MRFYHAAPREAMEKIIKERRIRRSADGCVYLCRRPEDSCKFLLIRGIKEMSVIEVKIAVRETKESNDHSETFFRCKAYTHDGDIELKGDERVFDYAFDL